MTKRMCGFAIIWLGITAVIGVAAQGGGSVGITVRETAGIRRTEYPVSARAPLPRGMVADLMHLRLQGTDAEVPGQFTAAGTWDDGSLRAVDVDFNASPGAAEARAFRLEYGASVLATAKPRSSLAVTEDADTIQVGSIRLGKRGWPLLTSISYRGEIVGTGPNGLTILDAAGNRHAFGTARSIQVEIVKRGPLLVVVRYTGIVPLDAGAEVPVTLNCELPNSKTWIKITATVEDPAQRVRGLAIETPLALGPHPWTWDFGTDSGTYGAFRGPTDSVLLTQVVAPGGNSWRAETGAPGERRVYEQSVPGGTGTVAGWGHVLDARNAVAFAFDRFAALPGTYSMALNGEGQTMFGLTVSQPATRHELTVYQHYVGTPVPIGAATSPTAMLRPLAVMVEK